MCLQHLTTHDEGFIVSSLKLLNFEINSFTKTIRIKTDPNCASMKHK